MKRRIALSIVAGIFLSNLLNSAPQKIGDVLSPWTPGVLDIHHINTGKGESVLFVLPDGTTLLVDAGATGQSKPRVTDPRPDGSRTPGDWISRYIDHMLAGNLEKTLDYAVVTHFHDDHMGYATDDSKWSKTGNYRLSGITEVGDRFRFTKLIDRGWPEYNYPEPLNSPFMQNYKSFIEFHRQQHGLRMERFQPGRNDQITLVHQPKRYANFEIRNVAANGEVWTGVGSNTARQFPPIESVPDGDRPSENMCCIAFRLSYGRFDYFTGGDIVGIPDEGAPLWHDVETPVARAVGPVDVHELNHHGYLDSQNAFFLSALRPRVCILQAWSPSHPTPRTLRRLLSRRLYPGPRDIFATNLMEENRVVIGDNLEKLKSRQGHIVVRVEPGGESYRITILDDSAESFRINAVHGPYPSQ